jgi:hypothetical protein
MTVDRDTLRTSFRLIGFAGEALAEKAITIGCLERTTKLR